MLKLKVDQIADPKLTSEITTEQAEQALKAHSEAIGCDFGHCIEGVTDLLTDLRHYCDAHNISFFESLDDSYIHYLAEKKGVL